MARDQYLHIILSYFTLDSSIFSTADKGSHHIGLLPQSNEEHTAMIQTR